MIAAYVAVIAGVVVGAVYLWTVLDGLLHARAEMKAHGGGKLGAVHSVPDQVYRDQEKGLLVQSAAGVVLSTLALAVLALGPVTWYLVPFLSIGTAIAVIVAFAVERRDRAQRSA
jgi:hypothetical protein